jgi:hypothetical protein
MKQFNKEVLKMAKEKVLKNISKENKKRQNNGKWQRPTLEDVSEKIMAQPYIRFT